MDDRYALAFEEAKRAIAQQDAALGNLRQRAAGLLTAATALATFAAGLGLFGTDPTKDTVLAEWVSLALVALVVAIGGCMIFVLVPAHGWVFSNNAAAIVTGYIEAAPTPATIDDIHRQLAIDMTGDYAENTTMLTHRYRAYQFAAALLLAQTGLLVGGFTVWAV